MPKFKDLDCREIKDDVEILRMVLCWRGYLHIDRRRWWHHIGTPLIESKKVVPTLPCYTPSILEGLIRLRTPSDGVVEDCIAVPSRALAWTQVLWTSTLSTIPT